MSANKTVYCLEKLTDYFEFERLCSDLMSAFGYKAIEPLGGTKDKGRDALFQNKKNGQVTIFAYSIRKDWKKKILEDAQKIKDNGHICVEFVFVTTAPITSSELDDIKSEIKIKFGWKTEIFSLERLRVMLDSSYPEIKSNYSNIFIINDKDKNQNQNGFFNVGDKNEVLSQINSVMDYGVKTEFQHELDTVKDLINKQQPNAALTILKDLKDRIWYQADDIVKFRILTNLGAANLSLENDDEACQFFIEAYQYNQDDEKSLTNIALAHLISGNKKEALKYVNKALEKNSTNQTAISILIQSVDNIERDAFFKKIPASVKDKAEINFALGFVERKNKNYEEAERYLRKSLEADNEKSLEIPSTLADVLIEKNLSSLKRMEQEGVVKKENIEIEESIKLLSDVWKQVENTELAKPKVDWLISKSFAQRLLGKSDDALIDAKLAYKIDPNNERGIRNYAILVWETGNGEEAYKLLEPFNKSNNFPEAAYLMAIIKREKGDYDASIDLIKKQLNISGIDNTTKKDGLELIIETYIMAGKIFEAEEYINQELGKNKRDIVLLIFKSRLLLNNNEKEKAVEQAKLAQSYLNKDSTYADKLVVASQLYKLELYDLSQVIYEEIVNKTIYSNMTYRLLCCFYKTNNYSKALRLCQLITKKNGVIEDVLNIQSSIQEELGDLSGVKKTYLKVLSSNSENTSIKLNLGFLLLRQNEFINLDKFLKENTFDLEKLSLMERYRLAYLFSVRGSYNEFFRIIYETRRKFFEENRAHIEYIRLFFMAANEKDKLLKVEEVGIGTGVAIKYPNGIIEHYIIDDRKDILKAQKEISPTEDLALKLIGKKVGDKVEIASRVLIEIVEVKSKYVHVLHQSMALQQAQFNNNPDLYSINLGEPKNPGELPEGFDDIKEQVSNLHEHQKKVATLYKEKQLTIGAFSSFIGRNIIEVWGGIIADSDLGVYCSHGDFQERVNAINELKDNVQLVIDPVALLTIHSLEIGDMIVLKYGKLGISQATLDLITEQINSLEPIKNKGFMTLSKEGEQFTKMVIKPETIKKNIEYLTKLQKWINKNCEILSVKKIDDINKTDKNKLEEIIGISSSDTLLISRQKNKILFTDDAVLRSLGKGEYKINGVWTQLILMDALNKGFIDLKTYNDKVVKLVGLNYHYISVDGKNLYHAYKKANNKFEEPFLSMARILTHSYSDTNSAIKVLVDFLYEIGAEQIIITDFKNTLFNLLNMIVEDRDINEVINKLKEELKKRFYLIPQNIIVIDSVVKDWLKLEQTKKS